MNDKKQTNPNTKTGLIDRRFFLKASSATVVAVAVGGAISTQNPGDQLPAAENSVASVPAGTDDKNKTNKQWKAGWMAF